MGSWKYGSVCMLLVGSATLGGASCSGTDPEGDDSATKITNPAVTEDVDETPQALASCSFHWHCAHCDDHKKRCCLYFCADIVVPHECKTLSC